MTNTFPSSASGRCSFGKCAMGGPRTNPWRHLVSGYRPLFTRRWSVGDDREFKSTRIGTDIACSAR